MRQASKLKTSTAENNSPMKATPFEYKYRFLIHALIYMLGFWSPWLLIPALTSTNIYSVTDRSTWLVLSTWIWRARGLQSFMGAVDAVLILALVLLALGAFLRIWGSAYVGASVVQSRSMHGDAMLADGPYRRTRNPLYLGTLLHTIGIAIIMPPSGAIFAVALLWIFQVRLALAEEPFLAARFGQPYLAYKSEVPRFLPALRPLVPAAGQRPHWMQSVLGELYFLGAFLVLAIFGWSFNAQPIRQGILISLGVWLIVRAFMPSTKPAPAN
jgi:protein-S-isoprenylcysteine O-methyltransferase Ste14